MNDALKVKAYELLIEKLQAEVDESHREMDRLSDKSTLEHNTLLEIIHKTWGYEALRQVAIASDVKHDTGLLEFVECTSWGDDE